MNRIKKNRKEQINLFFKKLYSFLVEAILRVLEALLFLSLTLPILISVFLCKLILNCFYLGFFIGNEAADKAAIYLFNDKE